MAFKDTPDGQTNYCNHKNTNPSGICDACLGIIHIGGESKDEIKAEDKWHMTNTTDWRGEFDKIYRKGFFSNVEIVDKVTCKLL
jgi:hypothetical protein